MPLEIKVKHKGLVPKATKREIQKLKADTLRGMAIDWHGTYSQFKFTTGAARKYNYRKRRTKNIRTGKITTRKTGKWRPTSGNPLVWSGRSRSLARNVTFKANSKRSHASYPVRALNFKPPGFPRGQLRYEFTLVLQSEQDELARAAERRMRDLFTKGRRGITVRRTR